MMKAKAKIKMAAKGRGKAPLRRRTAGDYNVIRSFRMRKSTLARFDNYCNRLKISRAELLRRFIAELPARGDKRNTVRVDVI